MHLIAQSQPEVKDNLEFFKELRRRINCFRSLDGKKPPIPAILLYESLFLEEPTLKELWITSKQLSELIGYTVPRIRYYLNQLREYGLIEQSFRYNKKYKTLVIRLRLNHPDNINKLESVA